MAFVGNCHSSIQVAGATKEPVIDLEEVFVDVDTY